ncbi:MAG TPA: HAD family hydrolase [Anaerolineales bacterium]|nr:HAD family hydrolase [Anaerolineales bacterium]
MLEVIAFDADDTLWHNEEYYTQAKAVFIQILSRYHNPEWVEQRLDEIEIHNVQAYGYGIKSFVLSMLESAVELSSGQVAGSEIQEILALGKGMLAEEVRLIDHAEETLGQLAPDYQLMLITKGDTFEQERKVRRSGLVKYFRYIEIVGEKTRLAYQTLLDKHNIAAPKFLMVGNSLRSDILPVLEIGAQAVYVPYPHTWSHENIVGDALDNHNYHEIGDLSQLPVVLRRLNHR